MGRISPLLLLSRDRCHRLRVSKESATNLFELNLMIVSLNLYTVFIHIHPQRAASVSFFFFPFGRRWALEVTGGNGGLEEEDLCRLYAAVFIISA